MKSLKRIAPPRPFQTWYFRPGNKGIVPDKVGHAASRMGAIRAAVNGVRTSEGVVQGVTPAYNRVEIYDECMDRCNTVERRSDVVAIRGYY